MSKLSVIYAGLCAAILSVGLAVQAGQGGVTPSETAFSEEQLRAIIDATGMGPR